jgi:SAM-dependent methyltransferase
MLAAQPESPGTGEQDLVSFYEESYSHDGERADLYRRWRALGALGKADHAIALCERAGVRPQSTLEVGCGDGALLAELARRGFGGRLHGVEIAHAAVAIASAREEIDSVELYDGCTLDRAEHEHDLGILSHVLEHVPEPHALLAEVARACRWVLVEVPLERNLSARRASRREHAAAVGHLRSLSRDSMRATVARAGLQIAGELEDPLPLEVHMFFARGALARAGARSKWAARAGAHAIAPSIARRLFTVHYACLCSARSVR